MNYVDQIAMAIRSGCFNISVAILVAGGLIAWYISQIKNKGEK